MRDLASLGIEVDTSGVKRGVVELNKLSKAEESVTANSSRLKGSLGKTSKQTDQLARSTDNAAKKTKNLSNSFGTLRSAIGVLGLGVVARSLFKTTATLQDLEVRLKSLTKESGEFDAAQQFIINTAEKQHKSIGNLSDSYSRLRVLQNSGIISGNQTRSMLTGLNDAASALGANTAQLGQVFFGLAQGLSSPKLKAEELNQVMEPLPGLLQAMDKAVAGNGDVVAGSFRKMVLDGEVTSKMFSETLVKALEEFEGAAERMGGNLNASLTDVDNAWTKLVMTIEKEGSIPGAFKSVLDGITVTLNALADFDVFFFSTMAIADKFSVTLSTGFQTIVLEIEAAFKSMVQAGMESLASFTSSLANGASFLGLDSLSDSLNRFAISVTPGVSAADELDEKLRALGASSIAQKQAIDDNVVSYIRMNEGLKKSAKFTGNQNKVNEVTTEIIKKLTQAQKDRIEVEKQGQQLFNSLATDSEKNNDALIKATNLYNVGAIGLETYNRALEKFYQVQNKDSIEKESAIAQTFEEEIQGLIDYNNELVMTEKQYYLTGLAAQELSQDQIKKIEVQYDIVQSSKSIADAKKQLKEIDDSLSNFDGLEITFDVFGDLDSSIMDIGNAFEHMTDQLADNADMISQNKDAWKDYAANTNDIGQERSDNIAQFAKREQQLNEKTKNLYISGTLEMASSIGGMLNSIADMQEEGSQKQLAYQQAAVGVEAAVALAKGVTAVMNALQGDPYTAIPRAVITAGIVAAQLAQIGQSFSSISGGASAPSRQETQGRGSVLGDATAISESLGNSLENLEESYDIGLEHSSKMLVYLQNIDNNTKALAIGIYRSEEFQDFSANPYANLTTGIEKGAGGQFTDSVAGIFNSIPGGGSIIGTILDSAFGSRSKVTDTGIQFDPNQTVGNIFEGGLDSQYYSEIKSYDKAFWFKYNEKTTMAFTEIEGEIGTWFGNIVTGISSSVIEGTKILNEDSFDSVRSEILAFQTGLDAISLKDMDVDEMEEAIAGVFSKFSDELVLSVAPQLQAFQQTGEGLFETLVRVSTQVESAGMQLSMLGMEAIDYLDVVNKQGDIGAEIVRQTILQNEEYQSISEIMRVVTGDSKDLVDTYKDLHQAQSILMGTGLGSTALSSTLIGASGGLDPLNDNLDSFFEDYFSEQQRFDVNLKSMQDTFRNLNVEMPESKDQFKALVQGIDATTEEGQILLANLLSLSPAVSELSDDFERLDKGLAGFSIFVDDAIKLLGLSGKVNVKDVANDFGGVDVASDKWGRFFDHFYTDIERAEVTAVNSNNRINEAINSLGIDGLTKENYKDSFVAMLKAGFLTAEQQNIGLDVGILIADAQDQMDEYTDLLANQFTNIISLQETKYDKEIEYIDKISGYLDSLLLNDQLSTLTPAEKLAESRAQYSTQLALANSGDSEAIASITDFADTYLDQARSFYSSSDQYGQIFDNVTGSLGGLRDDIANQVSSDDPNSSITTAVFDQTKALIESSTADAQAILDALNKAYTQDQIQEYGLQSLFDGLQNQLDIESQVSGLTVAEGAQLQFEAIRKAEETQRLEAEKTRKAILLSTSVSDKDIQAFMDENRGDNLKIYDTAQDYGISADRLASNSEFSAQQIDQFGQDNGRDRLAGGGVGQAVKDSDIRSFLANESDPFKIYEAAIKNGITSSRLAANSQFTREQILEWADANNLPRFATGGVTTGLSLAGEDGTEAIIPIPSGYVEARVTGSVNQEMVSELKALREEVQLMRTERAQHTQLLIDSNYDANEMAANKISGATEKVAEQNRPEKMAVS